MFLFHLERAPWNGREDNLGELEKTHRDTQVRTHTPTPWNLTATSIILTFPARAQGFPLYFLWPVGYEAELILLEEGWLFSHLCVPQLLESQKELLDIEFTLPGRWQTGGGRQRERGCPADLFFNLSLWKPFFPLWVSVQARGMDNSALEIQREQSWRQLFLPEQTFH